MCYKLDQVRSEIGEVSRPTHDGGDVGKAGRSDIVQEFPAEVIETEAAFGGQRVSVVFRGLEMLDLAVSADPSSDKVLLPAVEGSRQEKGATTP